MLAGSLAVIAVINKATSPGRRSPGIRLVLSTFRYLIVRAHEARLATSRQLTFPHRARKGQSQESASHGHWPRSASCPFYMVGEL